MVDEEFINYYWIMSIFDKNKQIKDILLFWSSNSFYFNSSCIIFYNVDYQNKIVK